MLCDAMIWYMIHDIIWYGMICYYMIWYMIWYIWYDTWKQPNVTGTLFSQHTINFCWPVTWWNTCTPRKGVIRRTKWPQFSVPCEIITDNEEKNTSSGIRNKGWLWSYHHTSKKIFQCMLTKLPITKWGFLGQIIL